MIQGQNFPVLTQSRRVSPEFLEILKSTGTGAAKQSRVRALLLTWPDQATLQTLREFVERAWGPDHLAEAERRYRRGLGILPEALGPDHPIRAISALAASSRE